MKSLHLYIKSLEGTQKTFKIQQAYAAKIASEANFEDFSSYNMQ